MKKYVYSYFDKTIEAYSKPLICDVAPEVFVEQLKRTLKSKTNEVVKAVEAGLICCFLGCFNDATARFEQEDVQNLLDCNEYLESLKDIKEAV